MATYTPNIPQAWDRPSQSQSQILNNFQALQTQLNLEHQSLATAPDNTGKHKYVTMKLDPGGPAPVGTEVKLQWASANSKNSLEILNNVGVTHHIPLRIIRTVNTIAGAHTQNLITFTQALFGDDADGTILVCQKSGVKLRSILCPFLWDFPDLYLPGVTAGQLNSSIADWEGLDSNGALLRIITKTPYGGGDVYIVITESRAYP